MEKVIELIQSAGEGAFAIDRLQRVVFWNDACKRLLGFQASEVIGKYCYDVIGGSVDDGCLVCHSECESMRARSERRQVPPAQLKVRHKDGREVWVGLSTIMVPSTWSELSVLVHLVRDISAHKRIEDLASQLASQIDDLKAASASPLGSQQGSVPMTDREQQILVAMSTGKSSPEIADALHISKATVRNHVHNILSKLGVRNRLEAVIVGLRSGLL